MTATNLPPTRFRVTTPSGARADYETYDDALRAAHPISLNGAATITAYDAGYIAILGSETWKRGKRTYRSAGFTDQI